VLDSAEEKLSDHFETAFGFIEQGVAAGKALVFIFPWMHTFMGFLLTLARRHGHSRALLRGKISQCVRCALHGVHSRVLNM
jgi:hypothetical protein